jgi:hypothetical protein
VSIGDLIQQFLHKFADFETGRSAGDMDLQPGHERTKISRKGREVKTRRTQNRIISKLKFEISNERFHAKDAKGIVFKQNSSQLNRV